MKRLIACTALLFTISCAQGFQITAEGPDLKRKTIAVLCGTPFASTDMLASILTAELSRQTRFSVMPYANVKRILGESHRRIRGPYMHAYIEIEENYALTDVDALRQIRSMLDVDCLLVLWTPVELRDVITPHEGHTALPPVPVESVHIICQMYAFPGPLETGHGKAVLEYLGESAGEGTLKVNGKFVHASAKTAFTEWSNETAKQIARGSGI